MSDGGLGRNEQQRVLLTQSTGGGGGSKTEGRWSDAILVRSVVSCGGCGLNREDGGGVRNSEIERTRSSGGGGSTGAYGSQGGSGSRFQSVQQKERRNQKGKMEGSSGCCSPDPVAAAVDPMVARTKAPAAQKVEAVLVRQDRRERIKQEREGSRDSDAKIRER